MSARRASGRIRIGQIGTAHAHAEGKMASLRRSKDFEVVGVVEPDARRRAAAGRRDAYRGLSWLSEEDLLAADGLRAVAVETEVCDLLATAERALDAGMHVHLDKPAGESLPHFRRVLRLAKRRKLVVQMGYMFRYNAAFRFCCRAVRDGWIGRAFSLHTVMSKTVPPSVRRTLARYGGGAMFELGCHVIDSVVHVLGRPTRVTAFGRHCGRHDDGLLDNQLAVLEYPSATATVRSALMEVEGMRRRQFVVCGDAGTIDIRPLEPPHVRLTLARRRGRYRKGTQDVPVEDLPRYDADFADLVEVIRGRKPFEWSCAHDLAVQETVLLASGLATD